MTTRPCPFTIDELGYLIRRVGWWEIEEDCPEEMREHLLEKMEREGIRNAPQNEPPERLI